MEATQRVRPCGSVESLPGNTRLLAKAAIFLGYHLPCCLHLNGGNVGDRKASMEQGPQSFRRASASVPARWQRARLHMNLGDSQILPDPSSSRATYWAAVMEAEGGKEFNSFWGSRFWVWDDCCFSDFCGLFVCLFH